MSAALFSRLCFVIPTYNEAANIAPLLERLAGEWTHPETRFLIVDDQSPDGTGQRVRDCAEKDARIHLLEKPREGFARACIRGMQHATESLGAEIIVQMDADFSHDPDDVARLLEALEEADVAIGSRYVSGGRLDPNWPYIRVLLSRWANRLVRWLAGIRGVQDYTSGFKAIRSAALLRADIAKIRARGYAFQVELLCRFLACDSRVVEVPILFADRVRGQSKLSLGNLLDFGYSMLRIRLSLHRAFLKYATTGVTGIGVNLGAFHLLLEAGLHKYLASPIAIEISIVTNFLLNFYWTFADRHLPGRKRIRGLRFNLVSLAVLGANFSAFLALSAALPETSPLLLQALAILPGVAFGYALNSRWTFRGGARPNAPTRGEGSKG